MMYEGLIYTAYISGSILITMILYGCIVIYKVKNAL